MLNNKNNTLTEKNHKLDSGGEPQKKVAIQLYIFLLILFYMPDTVHHTKTNTLPLEELSLAGFEGKGCS